MAELEERRVWGKAPGKTATKGKREERTFKEDIKIGGNPGGEIELQSKEW